MAASAGVDVSWHLNKTITVGILTALISVIGALVGISAQGLWFAAKLEARVATLEDQRKSDLAQQAERDARQDRTNAESDARLEVYLRRIEQKLDEIREGRKK